MRRKNHALTILVAPSGYGKTTAIKQLQTMNPEARFSRYSARKMEAGFADAAFCQAISMIDPQTGSLLEQSLLIPQPDIHQAARALQAMTAPKDETAFLIIEDAHNLLETMPLQLFNTLLTLKTPRLHLVLCSLPFEHEQLQHDPYQVLWIGQGLLTMTEQDILGSFHQSGISLSPEEARQILHETGGWPAAVADCKKLQARGITFKPMDVTQRLLSQVWYDRLDAISQQMMLGLSQFDSLTHKEISLLQGNLTARKAREALLRAPLMRQASGAMSFVMQPGLRLFLQTHLDNSPPQTRAQILLQTGHFHAREGRLPQAIGCFYAAKEYEAILSLNLRLLSFTMIGDVPFEQVARHVVEDCPVQVLRRHPISLLRLAYLLYSAGDLAGYRLAMSKAERFISAKDEPHLYGEWLIMSMIAQLPDIPAMHATLLKAEKYLQGPSRAIAAEEPFLFGSPSMWYMFYATPGEGDLVATHLENWLLDYQRICTNRGMGGAMLYRAELASMRCQYERSDAYLQSAMAQAEDAMQPTILYGSVLLMARNAIAQRDDKALKTALDLLNSKYRFPALEGTALHQTMLDTVRIIALSMMREVGMSVEQIELSPQMERSQSILTQMTLNTRVINLLHQKQTRQAIGLMQAALQKESRLYSTVMNYVLNMALALYHWLSGRQAEAVEYFRASLRVAQPDGLYAMYVNHWEYLRTIIRQPAMEEFEDFFKRVDDLYQEQHGQAEQVLHKEEVQVNLPPTLSRREREVAQLASQGLTNPEIAKLLFVTESTVKKHMQTLFSKLNIDRRAKLIEMFRTQIK